MTHTNFVNNSAYLNNTNGRYSYLIDNNYFNNFITKNGKVYSLAFNSNMPAVDKASNPSYLGTSREDLVRPYIYEMGNADNTWGVIDLDNMPSQPISGTHGIVWKILVNGKDAQDEFEELAPLGVGKHKFEVYFNRPMNKNAIPQISFGVRSPYTQQSVAENGSWNDDGTIYTAYKTIDGRTNSDGLNRIYVYGAEDDEFFECPYENTRFNILVQAVGSMATGFAAEPGLGSVKLTWNNDNNNFEDAMGFNVYRYNEPYQITLPSGYRDDGMWHFAETVTVCDTVILNKDILDLETLSFTDDDVTAGTTYYYYYKVLNTDLKEYDVSNVVAATPLTSTKGDANGTGEMDVADVVTTVNYILRQNPKPFIFEAADMNNDLIVDVLDVVEMVSAILNPSLLASTLTDSQAKFSIEEGILYVDASIPLAGVQISLTGLTSEPVTCDNMKGLEKASVWLSDNDYMMMAYSMTGSTLAPGKNAIMAIGNAQISTIRLCDAMGRNVEAIGINNATIINRMGSDVMSVAGVYDLQGRKIALHNNKNIKRGVYIINGKKVVK